MRRTLLYSVALACIALIPACGGNNTVKEKSEKAKTAYTAALEDSIRAVQSEIDSCNSQIDILRENVKNLMSNFTMVTNPREVGGYMIVADWKNKYPLSGTGLVARIDNNRRFELIAANGKPFDRITVKSPTSNVTSAVVPNDQALNYRTASLTTVMFSGEEAEAIGQLIADNALNPLTLIFESPSPVNSWKIPLENSKMISLTYALYRDNRELQRLEQRVPMLHEKINLIRQHKDNKKGL